MLIFSQPPKPSDLLGIDELELALIVCPCDDFFVLLQSEVKEHKSANVSVMNLEVELTCWLRSNSSRNCHKVMLVSIPRDGERKGNG